jgi:hypothetical protein
MRETSEGDDTPDFYDDPRHKEDEEDGIDIGDPTAEIVSEIVSADAVDYKPPQERPEEGTGWTVAEQDAVDHYAGRAQRVLEELDQHARQGEGLADALPGVARQDLLDFTEDLRIDGALTRERIDRLARQDGELTQPSLRS